MRCERGHCLVCDKVIARVCDGCKSAWRNTEEYTHVQVKWSNGSLMDVAVCAGCAENEVHKADKAEMTRAIQAAWSKNGGTYDKAVCIV